MTRRSGDGRLAALLAGTVLVCACGGGPGQPVELVVPEGASLAVVADTLAARGVIGARGPFELYVKLRGEQRNLKAGRYVLRTESAWGDVLGRLTRGEVVTEPLTIPEGFRLVQMVERIADITERPEEEVAAALEAPDAEVFYGVPGPGLEGYLFPDTYLFARGVSVGTVLDAMAARYRALWTPERSARRDSLGMTERELVTLASIIQAEARMADEMPRISSVYHNRLREGWLLQADPTVLYALGGPRPRLLFAAIDSVQDSPYNTYTQPGLPPGPIGAPGEAAIVAALWPAEEAFMYFVARPDGSHVFSRTLTEHNRAREESRREREAAGREPQERPPDAQDGEP